MWPTHVMSDFPSIVFMLVLVCYIFNTIENVTLLLPLRKCEIIFLTKKNCE